MATDVMGVMGWPADERLQRHAERKARGVFMTYGGAPVAVRLSWRFVEEALGCRCFGPDARWEPRSLAELREPVADVWREGTDAPAPGEVHSNGANLRAGRPAGRLKPERAARLREYLEANSPPDTLRWAERKAELRSASAIPLDEWKERRGGPWRDLPNEDEAEVQDAIAARMNAEIDWLRGDLLSDWDEALAEDSRRG